MRTLLRRIAELPEAPEAGPALREGLPSPADWDPHRELTGRVHRAMRERFGVDSLAAHPFSRLAAHLLADERAFGKAEQLCNDAETLLNALDPLLDSAATLIGPDSPLQEAQKLAADSQWLLDAGLAAHLDLLDPASPAQAALRQARAELDACAEALAKTRTATSHWLDKFTPDDTQSALALVQRLEPTAMRWLQPAWWRLRGEIKRRYDFSKHAVHPGYRKVLEALAAEHAAIAALTAADAACRQRYGVAEMQSFLRSLAELEQRMQSGNGPRALIAHLRNAVDPIASAHAEASMGDTLGKLTTRVHDNLALPASAPWAPSPNCCATCAKPWTTCPTCCRCCAPCTAPAPPTRPPCNRSTTRRRNWMRWCWMKPCDASNAGTRPWRA